MYVCTVVGVLSAAAARAKKGAAGIFGFRAISRSPICPGRPTTSKPPSEKRSGRHRSREKVRSFWVDACFAVLLRRKKRLEQKNGPLFPPRAASFFRPTAGYALCVALGVSVVLCSRLWLVSALVHSMPALCGRVPLLVLGVGKRALRIMCGRDGRADHLGLSVPGLRAPVLGSCSNSSFGTTAVCERRCVFYLLPTWCITQHAFPTRLSFVHNSRGRLWNLRISAKTRIRICPPPAPRAPCVCLPPLATLDFHASHFKLDRSLSLKAKRT